MGTLQQQSVLKGRSCKSRGDEIFVHKILRSVAAQFPKRTAILYDDESGKRHEISYEDLELVSNQLARVLRKRRYQNLEDFVAVSLRPSHNLIVLLLSILKSGMAYLPLDPDYPGARVKHIMQEAEPTLVVVENDADRSLYEGKPCITMGQLLKEASEESSDQTDFPVNSEKLAIILYTSGSTGVPKGVKLPHATLMNRLQWQWRELPFGPTEQLCVFKTALTFVDSAPEIWSVLLQARTLVVVPRRYTKDPEKFIEILEKHKIQRLVLVPSLLQSLLMYLNLQQRSNALSDLKLWICSGETLPLKLAENFFQRFNDGERVLANFYGSTEVMGDVTFHLVSDVRQLHGLEKVPIGKPVDNCVIYLVNKDMHLVPQGEVGEIIVAGKNLAAGYIRGRDVHKFLSNPHAIDPEYSVVFRTGDYARIVKDIIMYEGRTDSQIKVRGHRVDLTEVEKTVATAPAVDKAVVLCYKPGELSQTLVAFVTSKKNVSISGLQIEDFLRKILPPYMMPQVVVVNSIPLLTNGKTDRQHLLKQYEAMNQSENKDQIEFDYSSVPLEHVDKAKVLFPTVASAIGHGIRDVVTVNSNFYELGGDSLNSVYTVTKLRDQGYHISITDFITAKNMTEILCKMKVNWDSDSLEDTQGSKLYMIEELNDAHMDEVVDMITASFYSKADLERWLIPDVKRDDYRKLMVKIWKPMVEAGLSFVLKAVDTGKILGCALNFDARNEPDVEIETKLHIVFEFLEFVEGPIRESKLPLGLGQIFHVSMMTTSQDLGPSENVIIMREMEYHCLEVAKRKGFAGIFTTNTSPLTQQLGTDIYNYEVMLDYQVNKYVAPDGTRPFGKAPDDQRAVCSWKPIRQDE